MDRLTNGLNWFSTVIACAAMTVVAFSGCTHAKPAFKECVSRCGMYLSYDKPNGSLDCDTLQEAEDISIRKLSALRLFDYRFDEENICKSLFGWQIHLVDDVIATDPIINAGAPWVGATKHGSKEMFLCKTESWRKSSFTHEVAHIAQAGRPLESWMIWQSPEWAGPGHNGWTELGVYDIINEVRKEK